MRGTHQAFGRLIPPVRGWPLAGAKFAGALAGDVAKNAPERAEAVPAGPVRDLGNGQVGIAQQGDGALDAARKQVAMRRHAEGLAKLACKVRFGHRAHLRQPADRPRLMGRGVHPVLRAQQPPQ